MVDLTPAPSKKPGGWQTAPAPTPESAVHVCEGRGMSWIASRTSCCSVIKAGDVSYKVSLPVTSRVCPFCLIWKT